MRTLIINADDFCLTPEVCRGILQAAEAGTVLSTTAMLCFPRSAERLAVFGPEFPGAVGLHLQLTRGIPVLPAGEVPSLVRNGIFPRTPDDENPPDPEEVLKEWHAQAELFEKKLGRKPTHIDTHHHVHLLEGVFEAYVRFAAELGVPARNNDPARSPMLKEAGVPVADVCVDSWYGPDGGENLLALLLEAREQCPDNGCIELMSHPGVASAELYQASTYAAEREVDLAMVTAPEFIAAAGEMGFVFKDMTALLDKEAHRI